MLNDGSRQHATVDPQEALRTPPRGGRSCPDGLDADGRRPVPADFARDCLGRDLAEAIPRTATNEIRIRADRVGIAQCDVCASRCADMRESPVMRICAHIRRVVRIPFLRQSFQRFSNAGE